MMSLSVPFPASVWWLVPVEVMSGFALLWQLATWVGNSQVRRLVLASFGVRTLFALALFAISFWQWPILKSLQLSNGFWIFGLDARAYHFFGGGIAAAWEHGLELPRTELGIEYMALVGFIYKWLGTHPLYAILVNSWLAAANGLLVYGIGRRLFGSRTAVGACLLVAFWPSSLLWSAQLLKDAVSWTLIFSSLWLMVSLLPARQQPRPAIGWWCVRATLLAVVVVLLTRLRFYIGSTLSLATLLTLIPAAVVAMWQRRLMAGVTYLTVTSVVVLAALFARTLDVLTLLSPAHPERGHYKLAITHWQDSKLEQAAEEFSRATAAWSGYKEAYLGLAAVEVQQARWLPAVAAYEGYLDQVGPEERLQVKPIIARLYLEVGNYQMGIGHPPEAIPAYEAAMAFDPQLGQAVANLGLALAMRDQFAQAYALSTQALALSASEAEREAFRRVVARTYVEKARVDMRQGHREEAFLTFEEARRLDPSSALVSAEFGLALAQAGFFERALPLCEHALTLRSATDERWVRQVVAHAYLELARYALEQEQLVKALAAAERAFTIDPSSLPPSIVLGTLFVECAEFQRAHEMFEWALQSGLPLGANQRQRELLSDQYLRMGDARFVGGQIALAVAFYERAREIAPWWRRAGQRLEAALANVGRLDQSSAPKREERVAEIPLDPAGDQKAPLASGSDRTQALLPAADRLLADGTRELLETTQSDVAEMALALFSAKAGQAFPNRRVSPQPYHLSQMDDAAIQSAVEASPESLGSLRRGFVLTGGYSLMDARAYISTPGKLLQYLPRALAIGFLAPFPRHWLDTKGSTGVMRLLAGGEMVLVYLLMPAALLGIWRVVRRREVGGLLLLAFILGTASAISLVVANLGTLFRLRLLFLFPLLIMAVHGEPLAVYGRLLRWLKRWKPWIEPSARRSPVFAIAHGAEKTRRDMAPAPAVSVVIPAYNAAKTIGSAIQSVLNQTFQDLEVIVVDDGSTDETPSQAQLFNGHIRYVRQEHAGPGAARNRGVTEARGAFLAFLDADDLWFPNKLEAQLEIFRREPSVEAVQCSAYLVNDALEVIETRACRPKQDTYLDVLRFRNLPALSSTLLVRKAYLESVGGFSADFEETWDMACRLARHGRLRSMPDFLALYRQHPGNRSHDMRIFRGSGFRTLRRVFADPTLEPAVRRHQASIWARFYAMLAGGYWRHRNWRQTLRWARRALATSPTVFGYLADLPMRRLRRTFTAKRRISFAGQFPFARLLDRREHDVMSGARGN